MLSIVLVCALLTYGGVSLFVVVFAVYPFAAELFRQSDIPKRLIPGTIALGAFTFTMDALPGTPQIQNIIPTTFFSTNTWAAPWLGMIGAVFILAVGLTTSSGGAAAPPRPAKAMATTCATSRSRSPASNLPNPWIAILPLVLVGVMNKLFTERDPAASTARRTQSALAGNAAPVVRKCQGHRDLGGGGRAAGRHPHGARLRLEAGDGEVRRRQQVGHRRRAAGVDEHRLGVRLRRRDRRAAGLPGVADALQGDPQSAGQRSDHA